MTNSFKNSPKYLLTSESVTEGHPDKICDQISDAILDTIMADDPNGRVACETAVTTGLVVVMGEITTSCYVDVPQVVRQVVRDIGYTNPEYGFDYQSCGILDGIKEQSTDIDMGVSQSQEVKTGVGADDLDKTHFTTDENGIFAVIRGMKLYPIEKTGFDKGNLKTAQKYERYTRSTLRRILNAPDILINYHAVYPFLKLLWGISDGLYLFASALIFSEE